MGDLDFFDLDDLLYIWFIEVDGVVYRFKSQKEAEKFIKEKCKISVSTDGRSFLVHKRGVSK